MKLEGIHASLKNHVKELAKGITAKKDKVVLGCLTDIDEQINSITEFFEEHGQAVQDFIDNHGSEEISEQLEELKTKANHGVKVATKTLDVFREQLENEKTSPKHVVPLQTEATVLIELLEEITTDPKYSTLVEDYLK